MHPPETTITMTREEAADFFNAEGWYDFPKATGHAARRLASYLRGGKRADPDNIGSAIRSAEELERRFEAVVVHRSIAPAPEPETPRPVPPLDDLPALLSSASSDAPYIKRLTYGGAGMDLGSNIAEALRVVRELRPKLEAAWKIYETMPKPEYQPMPPEAQAEFWRRMNEEAERFGAEALGE